MSIKAGWWSCWNATPPSFELGQPEYISHPPNPSKYYATGEGLEVAAVGKKSIIVLQTMNCQII